MKALTLTQPWATLVAVGAKRIETRSWPTSYRGEIAIHAAKGFPAFAKDLCTAAKICTAMGWPVAPNPLTQEWLDDNARRIKALPIGCVVATARIVNCLDVDSIRKHVQPFTEQEEAFGNYEPRRFGFLLDDIVALPEPVPAKGALGLWDWNAAVWPKCECGGVAVANASDDITRTCIRCGGIVKPVGAEAPHA